MLHLYRSTCHLHPLLQQIRALDRSADTTEERAIRDRVTGVELLRLRRVHTTPEMVDLPWSATE